MITSLGRSPGLSAAALVAVVWVPLLRVLEVGPTNYLARVFFVWTLAILNPAFFGSDPVLMYSLLERAA